MKTEFNRIVIAGAGAGYWAALALNRLFGRSMRIEVWDPDTFEGGTGATRLPNSIIPTTKKAHLLRDHCVFFMGDEAPTVHPERLTPERFAEGDWTRTLWIDATDMGYRERAALWEAAKKAKATGIRMSYDGTGVITISPGPPMIAGDAPEESEGGYGIIPHIGQAMMAAGFLTCAVVDAVMTGNIQELNYFMKNPAIQENRVDEMTEGIMDRYSNLFTNLAKGVDNDRDSNQ